MAVAEVGDEKYILSATMHADERNKALSEQLGKDVYHYHLHVVYIPVVQKEILYSKQNYSIYTKEYSHLKFNFNIKSF